jgi:RES domain-containing protein
VTVYRIVNSKYPSNNGAGAAMRGGRWNHKGTPLVYCGATASLCALEVLANGAVLPKSRVVIAAEIPDSLKIEHLVDSDLPLNWNDEIAPDSTKDFGTKWAATNSSAILSVPSAIVPDERNFLINPLHPDFHKIKFSAPKPFVFDPRLKK